MNDIVTILKLIKMEAMNAPSSSFTLIVEIKLLSSKSVAIHTQNRKLEMPLVHRKKLEETIRQKTSQCTEACGEIGHFRPSKPFL